jgi:hypothetical protein
MAAPVEADMQAWKKVAGFVEGFGMSTGDVGGTGGVVRKPPKKEIAVRWARVSLSI